MPSALDASLYYNRKRRRQLHRPEDHNSTTEQFPAGASTTPSLVTIATAAAFGCDLIIGAAAQGLIFGMGDGTTGALVGIDGQGDLIARFGDAAFARLVIPSAFVPRDRGVYLGWSFILNDSVAVWFDGRLAGRAVVTGSPAAWSASSDVAFLDPSATVGPTEPGVGALVGITARSSLRYLARRVEVY